MLGGSASNVDDVNMTTTRIASGYYEITSGGHVWTVFQVESAYGDLQWIIDRDDCPAYGTCDTLRDAKATIRAAR